MKFIHKIFYRSCPILLGAALLVAGCSREARDDAADTYEQAAETTRTIGGDTKEWFASTWQTVSSFTFEQRETFVEKLQTATETANEQVRDFTESGADVSEEAVARYKDARDALQEKLAAATDDENWEKAKAEVQDAWRNLKSATDKLLETDTQPDDR